MPPPWGIGIIAKGLGNTFSTPLEILPNTHGRYLNTPITDIGTRDKLYLYQMEALIDPIKGFNRYEKKLQSVTKQGAVGN